MLGTFGHSPPVMQPALVVFTQRINHVLLDTSWKHLAEHIIHTLVRENAPLWHCGAVLCVEMNGDFPQSVSAEVTGVGEDSVDGVPGMNVRI